VTTNNTNNTNNTSEQQPDPVVLSDTELERAREFRHRHPEIYRLSRIDASDLKCFGPPFLEWAHRCADQDVEDAVNQAEAESIHRARTVMEAFAKYLLSQARAAQASGEGFVP
jgi:hypothetical protein